MHDATHEMRFLRDVMLRASDLAAQRFREGPEKWEKSPGQILTQTDLDVNALVHEAVSNAFPEDGWLSEETPDDGLRLHRESIWIIDPIDGTRSFARGRPEFSISLGRTRNGDVVLGSVSNPTEGEMFLAAKGQGAMFGATRLAVRRLSDGDALELVVSGGEMQRKLFRTALDGAEISKCGSVAWKLARVARGDFHATVSLRSLHEWDIAAGVLLVREAGGEVTDQYGRPLCFNKEQPVVSGMIAGHPDTVRKIRDAMAPHLDRIS